MNVNDVMDIVIKHHLWLIPLFILLLAFIINRIIKAFIRRRLKAFKPHRDVWRHAIYISIEKPLRAAIWLLAIVIIKHRLSNYIDISRIQFMYAPIVDILLTCILAWFLLGMTEQFKKNYTTSLASNQKEIDYTIIDAINKLVWAAVLIFTGISVLQQLQVPLASLLAFGGAAGIAVGFAAQTLVSNLFGGLTVYASRIFKIGEDIIIPGTNLAGTVIHIGWRATHVLGWDGKPFYIPNSKFNSSNMINHSRLQHRAMTENILLRYENYDKVRELVKLGNNFLEQRSDVVYFVFRFDSFGNEALKIVLYAWIQPDPNKNFVPYAEYMRVKEDLLLNITDMAKELGCELLFPISNVYLNDKRSAEPIEAKPEGPLAGLQELEQ